MRIVNACRNLDRYFPDQVFCMERWENYMEALLPGASQMIRADVATYDFERQCMPVLQNALLCAGRRMEVTDAFDALAEGLEEKMQRIFHRTLDVEVILCLGLCNGAGWVTTLHGSTVVLLGIEKIIELDWCSQRDMVGLLYHELGHVYQAQYGVLKRDSASAADGFLWQLYTEGVAMCFEQILMGDPAFYHQDKHGWKAVLDAHLEALKHDFCRDMHTMDSRTQCYFGDWARYRGVGDAGYYLGAQFVQFVLKSYDFDQVISLDLPEVKVLFEKFLCE